MKIRARHSGFLRLAVAALALASWRPLAAAAPAGGGIPDAAAYTHEDSLFLRQVDSIRRQPLLDRASYVEGLRLQADEEACVAFDPGRGGCLLTVADFNRGVEEWPSIPGAERSGSASGLQVASLRRSMLQALLEEPYLRYKLAGDSAAEGLEREWRSLKDRRLAAARREAGDSTLRSRYRQRFERDFKAREERIVQVLATSDSAQADSLWTALAALPAGGSAGGRARSGWRWRCPDRGDLPMEALALADTLAKGQVSRPVRVPYGYLLVRWNSVHRRVAVPFEEAIPMLLSLPDFPDPDSSRAFRDRESRVAEYFRAHRREFLSPDTVRFRIRLRPYTRTRAGGSKDMDALAQERPGETRLAGFFDLPPSVQSQLGRYLPLGAGERLGPLLTPFGAWDFEVLGTAKGGRSLSLAEARPLILAALDPGGEEDIEQAIRNTQARDRQLWNQMATERLESRLPGDTARMALDQSDQPEPPDRPRDSAMPRTLAADKLEWLRTYLHVRFIAMGGES